MKHTPEPWEVDRVNGDTVVVANLRNGGLTADILATVSGTARRSEHGALLHANAERIVACVNACAGIENPAAVPELVEALKAIRDWNPVGSPVPFVDFASHTAAVALAALRGDAA